MHHTLAMHQGRCQCFAQLRLVRRVHVQAGDWQFNIVFLKTVNARETSGGQKVAIDPQMREPAWPCPVGKLGVDTLATGHQRRQ